MSRLNQMLSAQLLFRYGDTWAPWRSCGPIYGGGKEEEMELRSNEGINRLSGCSGDNDGCTRSLKATTTTGRTWGPHGDHKPDAISSLRSSPDADNLTLRYISGDQTATKIILRWLSSLGGSKKPKYKNSKSSLQFLVAFCFLITKI